MREVITRPEELLNLLGLGNEWLPAAQEAARLFPLRVPRGYASRMSHGNPDDPLLRQVLPLREELIGSPGFSRDAVGDLNSLLSPGLIQKYQGRALLITTGACAVHCRFCFRRHYPYNEKTATRGHWAMALEQIRNDDGLEEIILSGGDPLSLDDEKLEELVNSLESIPHLKRLRIHSRQPIVLPERVNDRLLASLSAGRLRKILVLHSNHAQEIDSQTIQALVKLKETGVALLNQAVLLKGVNDSVNAQRALSEALFSAGVLPYYLHLLDRVEGTWHYEVSEEKAKILMQEMAASMPGYLVPRLVREEAGKRNKSNVLW